LRLACRSSAKHVTMLGNFDLYCSMCSAARSSTVCGRGGRARPAEIAGSSPVVLGHLLQDLEHLVATSRAYISASFPATPTGFPAPRDGRAVRLNQLADLPHSDAGALLLREAARPPRPDRWRAGTAGRSAATGGRPGPPTGRRSPAPAGPTSVFCSCSTIDGSRGSGMAWAIRSKNRSGPLGSRRRPCRRRSPPRM
jgi:hypothetical protein